MSKISIVIPALNEEYFLPHLLTSLTRQTKKDFEVIVVDGSSNARTVDVAGSFISMLPKLEVLVSKKASLALQRNLGARGSNGDWLIFIDADSIVLPYFIERVENFIEEKHPVLFTTWFRPDSEVTGDALFTLVANLFVEGSIVFHRPIVPGPLAVIKRDVFNLVGGYDESLTFGEDYDLTHRIEALTPLRQMEWVVYAKPPFGGPAQVLEYLGRYTHRVALSNDRLVSVEDGQVRFRWKDYAHGDRVKTMTLPAAEFLRRFLLHVLPGGFVRIRHFGFLGLRRPARGAAEGCQTAAHAARDRPLRARTGKALPSVPGFRYNPHSL